MIQGKLNKSQAAEFLGVSEKTLSNWIWLKIGPRHIKFRGRVWFEKKDLEAFLRSEVEVRAS